MIQKNAKQERKKNMKKTIICVAGRNSAGKSLIAKKIAERHGLKVVQSYTTRKPRPEEIQNGLENSDHIFISDEEFDRLDGIVAQTTINGARYCTTIDMLKKCDLYVIDPNGIKDLKANAGKELHIVQFYIYANEDIRQSRYIARGESKAAFVKRNKDESPQFNAYEQDHGYDIVIYNNCDIDYAVDVMDSYISIILEQRIEEIEASEKKTEEVAEADTPKKDVSENADTSIEIDSEDAEQPSVDDDIESIDKSADNVELAANTTKNDGNADSDDFSLDDDIDGDSCESDAGSKLVGDEEFNLDDGSRQEENCEEKEDTDDVTKSEDIDDEDDEIIEID